MKKTGLLLAAALLTVYLLFDISLDVEFALPAEVVVPDAQQEQHYEQCVAERDAEIHRMAFSTIDNPDVQREYLSTHKDRAKAECRKMFPLLDTTVQRPFSFNLIDLHYRWGK